MLQSLKAPSINGFTQPYYLQLFCKFYFCRKFVLNAVGVWKFESYHHND